MSAPDDAAPAAEVREEPRTKLGGYGEIVAEWLQTGGGNPFVGDATVRRVTVDLSHSFRPAPLSVAAELEWENAIACDGCGGTVEIEQAVVSWRATRSLTVDAGLLLVPFGSLNLNHEPTLFHGVDRPRVDTLVAPSTWRELGVGIRTRGLVRAQAAVLTAPDPTRIGPNGLAGASGLGSHVRFNGLAVAARVEAEPVAGAVVAVNAYATEIGHNADFYDALGRPVSLALPLVGAAVDARAALGPAEARGEVVAFWFPNAGTLSAARNADGSPMFGDDPSNVVPTRWQGGYVEAAVDVLDVVATTDQELSPFARLSAWDSTAAVPAGKDRDPAREVVSWTFGLEYKPIRQVVIKADAELRDRTLGLDDRQLDLGLGWTF